MIDDVERLGEQVVVTLRGEIYSSDVENLHQRLDQYLDQGCRKLILELSGVNYLNSDFLGALVRLQRRAVSLSGEITITGVKGIVAELFSMTRMTKVFQIQEGSVPHSL